MTEIPIIPSQDDQDEAQAQLDAVGPGWRLANVIKGNFVAVRNGQEARTPWTIPLTTKSLSR